MPIKSNLIADFEKTPGSLPGDESTMQSIGYSPDMSFSFMT